MKNIYLKSLLLIAACVVVLSSCKDDEVPMYGGPQRVGFVSTSATGLVNNDQPANTALSVSIYGVKPADSPVTMTVNITKNTAGSNVEILTDLTKVTIPAGKISAEIQMKTSASYATRTDTIDFEIVSSSSDIATQKTIRYFIKGYCPMTQADLDGWSGGYGFVSSGRVYDVGPISMSHIANTDTIIVNISATALQNIFGPPAQSGLSNPVPFKICMKYDNPASYHATIEPQPFCVYDGAYELTISSTNVFTGGATYLSPVQSNCTRYITLQFYRPVIALNGSLSAVAVSLRRTS